MNWIKDNIVGIIFGALGSIGLIGSVASQVQDMATAYSQAFWWWTAAMLLVGVVIGIVVSGSGKKKSEDRLADIRETEETKRAKIVADGATERARIEANKELELERMRREELERQEIKTTEKHAALEAQKRDELISKLLNLPYHQADLLLDAITNGGMCERPKTDALAAALEESELIIKLASASGNIRATWKVPDQIREMYETQKEVSAALAEARYTAEQERLEQAARKRRAAFKSLDFNDQLFICIALNDDEIVLTEYEISDHECWGFLEYETIRPQTIKVYAPSSTKEFFRDNDDLLKHVKEYLRS